MFRASVLLLLLSCGAVLGCETGSTAQNVSTTGWKGQKVGKSSNTPGRFQVQPPVPREILRNHSQNRRKRNPKPPKTSTATNFYCRLLDSNSNSYL